MASLPSKRLLDIFPVNQEEEPFFVVRDPEGIVEEPIALRVVAALVWDLLDGRRDAMEVQEFIARHTKGTLIPTDQIEEIVRQLDDIYLLETRRLEARRREIRAEFARLKERRARFAGAGGYAADPKGLTAELEGYFTGDQGAGLPEKPSKKPLRGILSPHIDFKRGGTCYSHAYRKIAEHKPADLYVVLGVAHCSPEPAFVPTMKSFETPFGTVATDRGFVEKLLRKTKKSGLQDEVVHRMEHSIEFQTVFLQYARRHQPEFQIVPILCSSFERHCADGSPSSAPAIEDYLCAIEECIAESGRSVCIVAAVDFAHVGPRFGDQVPLDQKLIDWMMEGDKKSLAAVATCDAEEFWSSVMEDGNRRKVCGLSATYSALWLLKQGKGDLLRYGFAPDPAGGIVSFAAAAFH